MLLPSAARGTLSLLKPHAWHLSPAIGLALSAGGSHVLSRLYDLQPKVAIADGARGSNADGSSKVWSGSAAGALIRELFHRNHPHEPLRPTANRSLPAAHLSASLCAAIAGLAWERPGDAAVNSGLREIVCSETGLGVPKLARETGVSIARFERLVELVAAADAEDGAPLPGITGTALILRLLWMRSTTRRELWTYLTTLDARHDVLRSTAGVDAAAAFESMPRFTADELSGPSVEAAAKLLFQPEPGGDDTAVATAFETLAAALANGGSRAPPLNQGRYGFKGLPAVADCAELCARELLNALLWDPATQAFDTSRLPSTSHESLLQFYQPGGMAYHDPRGVERNTGGTSAEDAKWGVGVPQYAPSAARWFEMCSGLITLPPEHYLSTGGTRTTRYELAPSVDAIASCLGCLMGLGRTVRTPYDLQKLWSTIEPERHVQLSVNAYGDRLKMLEASTNGAGDECTLELVMSVGINHAFAIHHWRPPKWQRPLAELACANTSSLYTQSSSKEVGVALMPALMQPLLSTGSEAAVPALPHDKSERRWLLRLQLLSTEPTEHTSVGRALLRLLANSAADESSGNDNDDVQLGAGVLGASEGLSNADDETLVEVALAAARDGSPALRHAAMHAAPLAAPAAVLCGGDGALEAWARATASAPARCLRLSVQAMLRR